MRRKLLLASCLVLIITASAVGCTGISSVSNGQQSTGILVTGDGKVSAVPNVVILNLGIEAQAITVAEAQSQAATAMTTVVKEIDNHRIDKKDIKTQHFSIVPVRRFEKNRQILIGYRVTNMVTVKIRKVANTGAIIDAIARTGGDNTRINSLSFTIDDPAAYHKEARGKAMADAEAKAKQLADFSGVKLGKPIYINESGGFIPIPPHIPYRAAVEAAPTAPLPPISPGETEIRLSVQVAYSIQ